MSFPSTGNSGNQWWRAQPPVRSQSSLSPVFVTCHHAQIIHFSVERPWNDNMLLVLIWKFPDQRKGLHTTFMPPRSKVFSTYTWPTSMVAYFDHLTEGLVNGSEIVNAWLSGELGASSWDEPTKPWGQLASLYCSPLPVQVTRRDNLGCTLSKLRCLRWEEGTQIP